MSEYMYVVTNPEMGWDCVLGVFTDENRATNFCGDCLEYCIHRVEVNPENED